MCVETKYLRLFREARLGDHRRLAGVLAGRLDKCRRCIRSDGRASFQSARKWRRVTGDVHSRKHLHRKFDSCGGYGPQLRGNGSRILNSLILGCGAGALLSPIAHGGVLTEIVATNALLAWRAGEQS